MITKIENINYKLDISTQWFKENISNLLKNYEIWIPDDQYSRADIILKNKLTKKYIIMELKSYLGMEIIIENKIIKLNNWNISYIKSIKESKYNDLIEFRNNLKEFLDLDYIPKILFGIRTLNMSQNKYEFYIAELLEKDYPSYNRKESINTYEKKNDLKWFKYLKLNDLEWKKIY